MLVELPTVTTAPPDSTNCLICGMVFSSVMRPNQPRYSSGTFCGSAPPPPRPPPPPPPRPPAPLRIAPSGNTRTSKRLFRFPASNVGGYTTSKGNSYCSKSQRVHPEGISPPY